MVQGKRTNEREYYGFSIKAFSATKFDVKSTCTPILNGCMKNCWYSVLVTTDTTTKVKPGNCTTFLCAYTNIKCVGYTNFKCKGESG